MSVRLSRKHRGHLHDVVELDAQFPEAGDHVHSVPVQDKSLAVLVTSYISYLYR